MCNFSMSKKKKKRNSDRKLSELLSPSLMSGSRHLQAPGSFKWMVQEQCDSSVCPALPLQLKEQSLLGRHTCTPQTEKHLRR